MKGGGARMKWQENYLNNQNLYHKLVEYSKDNYYPMHMPGHKRNTDRIAMVNPYSIDITEIDGFDNLHHAEGILKDGMERAARLYGSEHTDYLINGSTVGILAGISACTNKGDTILVARNSHKAVYNAIYINELVPIYIYPQLEQEFGINGGLNPENIESLLMENPEVKLLVITSPTYEGVISDIKSIANIAHNYGVPLLVDEAHGAHLGFHSEFPENSVHLGADIVIHSLHKTLPAFTQTALIHVNSKLVDYNEVKRYLAIYQTSSPSYLLMASIEHCIDLLLEKKDSMFEEYNQLLHTFFKRMELLKNIKVLNPYHYRKYGFFQMDPSKITITVKDTNITGNQLYDQLLNQYKIQMEMVSMDYVLGMTSIFDNEEGFQRLGDALLAIDKETQKSRKATRESSTDKTNKNSMIIPEMIMNVNQAIQSPSENIAITESDNRIICEYIYLYPPGIPLFVPGEKVTKELINQILMNKENGLSIQGIQDTDCNYIKVVKQ